MHRGHCHGGPDTIEPLSGLGALSCARLNDFGRPFLCRNERTAYAVKFHPEKRPMADRALQLADMSFRPRRAAHQSWQHHQSRRQR